MLHFIRKCNIFKPKISKLVIKSMGVKDEKKTGHAIVTYQVRLYKRHFSWLIKTKELYVKVTAHFLSVLQREPELLAQSDFLLLRALETKCIGTKQMKATAMMPEYPLENFPKIPLYFRRSAINTAIDLARKKQFVEGNAEDKEQVELDSSMILYKGMYQNFSEHSIELKLFNGEKWMWVTYPFTGRMFATEAERMSPVLVIRKNTAYLNVPLKFLVSDVRTVKERMKTEEYICVVYFPDNDVLAVATILSKDGVEVEHRFFRGGKQKEYQRKNVLEQLRKSGKSRGQWNKAPIQKENVKYFEELKKLNRYYVHTISRQLLNYCLERKIKIIVVPNYEDMIDFSDKKYLKTDSYRWLGRSIIKKLNYKAFQQGIVVTSVRPYHIVDQCSICGATIRKYNEGHVPSTNYHGGKLFLCPNGHKGNTAKNATINMGKQFLSYYQKDSETM